MLSKFLDWQIEFMKIFSRFLDGRRHRAIMECFSILNVKSLKKILIVLLTGVTLLIVSGCGGGYYGDAYDNEYEYDGYQYEQDYEPNYNEYPDEYYPEDDYYPEDYYYYEPDYYEPDYYEPNYP